MCSLTLNYLRYNFILAYTRHKYSLRNNLIFMTQQCKMAKTDKASFL